MNVTEPRIMEYVQQVTPLPDQILQEMAIRAEERHFPYIGPFCGRVLYAIIAMTGAKRVFEFGSGFGYSLYWMAQAAPDGAQLIGTEYDEDNVKAAAGFLKRGGLGDKAQVWHGDALDLFRTLDGKFDIIVIDAEKTQYCEIFEMAAPRLNPGGLIIADNVLWSGRVIAETDDESTRAIQDYNELIFSDPRFFSLILPIRDGISISIKERD